MTDWVDDKPDGLEGFPWRFTGSTHVYNWTHSGSSMNKVNTPTENSESYLVAVDVNFVAEPALVERIRAIY